MLDLIFPSVCILYIYIYISRCKKAFLISENESRKMILQYPPKGSKKFSLLPWDL